LSRGKIRIMTVFGTRPEAIKMAPVVQALQESDRFEVVVAVTAQHREMLDQVLRLFEIEPKHDLDIMAADQTLFDVTSRSILGLNDVLTLEKPDMVLVHGDTTTTFAGALASFYHQILVGHVEAGLRTGDKYSPYPEEMNRKLTGVLTDLHFAPTETAKENLLKEGVPAERIMVTGNTVVDALLKTVKQGYTFDDPALNQALESEKRIILVTTHRRENLGEPMRQVYRALRDVLEAHPDTVAVFPVHKNPKVRDVVEAELGGHDRVVLIEPLDYEPFANLLNHSALILTDSGGIQEEAPSLGKPVLVLRSTTERPEAVGAGTVRLVGTDQDTVYQAAHELLSDEKAYLAMSTASNPYGDGTAATQIVEAIEKYFSQKVYKD
jgi:UDP-N-acetylglucosamine 2-epimerase (non-hydrolysing)